MLLTKLVTQVSDIPVSTLAVMLLLIVDIVGGAEDQMVMNMAFIRVRGNDIGIPSLEQSVGQFFTYLMSFFSRYLSWRKRLYQMERLIGVGTICM
jgi:hypothetical protein